MKLLWLSVAPWAPTGYGTVTRNVVRRMIDDGHEVTVATKHFHCGTVVWEGIPTIPGDSIARLNRLVKKGEFDYIISLLDNHGLNDVPANWISYTPFDTQHVPHSIAKWLVHPKMIIALTKHGQTELQNIGYDCEYVPHGVDMGKFYPDPILRELQRKEIGWEDNFIIGSVGINYDDDRKNYTGLLTAFKKFYDSHKDARLYLSTSPYDIQGNDTLIKLMERLDIVHLVKFGEPDSYYMGRVTDGMMANRYRMMDVFCMPTKGEGFGIPLIEAQACGTPVLTTGASTGPELCPTQLLM